MFVIVIFIYLYRTEHICVMACLQILPSFYLSLNKIASSAYSDVIAPSRINPISDGRVSPNMDEKDKTIIPSS